MHVLVGIAGLIVFLALAFLPSRDVGMLKKKAPYIGIMLALQFVLGLLMLRTGVGQAVISVIAAVFETLLGYAREGVSFVFGGLVDVEADGSGPFIFTSLMPIIVISALIGILQYLRILPLVIRGVGLVLSKVTGLGKLESFNAVSSAMIGQSENLIAIKRILPTLPEHRLYTIAASAMSTVSMSIVGAYMTMIEPRYVVAAIVLNLFGAFIIVSLLNPYTLTEEEDVIVEPEHSKQSFFQVLGEYITDGGKVVLSVVAMLVGFVALMAILNGIFDSVLGISFQQLLGYVFAPLAVLTGVPVSESVDVGRLMATKLISNEFVAMLSFTDANPGGKLELSARATAIAQTFLVSFANFSSIGIIAGAAKSLAPEQGETIARFGLRLLYGATLVSFVSATVVGIIV
ncbi:MULTISPECIES: NupC/NupG family nucleoside CNT transporter [Brachybacterium]|uniref:NupC/NupG family nucleoside CNT transporter n=1 Tax=Brachybacterium halotolerans TaxID=2795215 RepID=A0ABS1B658_9MICO|nr:MULTISPECIES: nucleoside transporter C-terminal domain-containing protein [Brachybacterium]MBK0330118.1 NupC/NupG family nucleoside CNT transporter [Brachybacterium halotolerans]MCG7308627.1 NupC/NupG family nucleoside CNT transporter [Brachybacterium sp. ACRRE]